MAIRVSDSMYTNLKMLRSTGLTPIPGHDVGIQVDMFGNETVYVTKSKGIAVQPTLDELLRDTGLLKKLQNK